jgi:glycosyltransferase involved in cell wall biosynthesis
MVVLHVSGNRFPPLPTPHHTLAIWRELAKDVDQYHVFGRATGWRGSVTSDGNLTVHLVPSLIRREAESLVTSLELLSLVRRVRPSVILCQCPVFGGLAATIACRRYGIPTMVELHGEHFFRDRQDSLRARAFQRLARPALQAATTIRVLTDDMQDSLSKTYGASVASKSIVIPTRVDLDVFSPAKTDYTLGDVLRIVTVGSYVPVKNHLALIAAMRDLPDTHLTIVGDGLLRGAYEAAIVNAGLQDRISLHPSIPQPQLSRVLAGQDVYVHYSRSEALSRAILEAMAMGLPVVATPVGFIKDVLRDGVNALLVHSPWERTLVSCLHRLRASEPLRRAIGESGLSTIRRGYEWNTVFEKYRQAIRKTVAAGPAPDRLKPA